MSVPSATLKPVAEQVELFVRVVERYLAGER